MCGDYRNAYESETSCVDATVKDVPIIINCVQFSSFSHSFSSILMSIVWKNLMMMH